MLLTVFIFKLHILLKLDIAEILLACGNKLGVVCICGVKSPSIALVGKVLDQYLIFSLVVLPLFIIPSGLFGV